MRCGGLGSLFIVVVITSCILYYLTSSPPLQNLQPPTGAFSSPRVLNVVFHFNALTPEDGGRIYEAEWITNLMLAGLKRPIRILNNPSPTDRLLDDSLHVVLFGPENATFFNVTMARRRNVGVFHMGDEQMNNPIFFYSHASYVLRNYYNKKYFQTFKNVHFIPLGTRMGYGTIVNRLQLLPPTLRRYHCNFMGSIRSNRQQMVDTVKSLNISVYLSVDASWGKPALKTFDYRGILKESVFTLAPWGNNFESMRLYEALEAGSIPILQKINDSNLDFVTGGLGANPLPIVKDWSEVGSLIRLYIMDMAKLTSLHYEVISWWTATKSRYQRHVAHVIDSSFHRAYGYS